MSPTKALSYLSSLTVLEYLSFSKRKHLYVTCPSIRKVEERPPYRLGYVKIRCMSRNLITMDFENLGIRFWRNNGDTIIVDQNTQTKGKLVKRLTTSPKAQEAYATCPEIRKTEELVPYSLESVKIRCMLKNMITMIFEHLGFGFCLNAKNNTESLEKPVTTVSVEEAAEKFVLYNLSRKGTQICHLELKFAPLCLPKCMPITVPRLVVSEFSNSPNGYSTWIRTTKPVKNVETDWVIRDDTISNAKHVRVTGRFLNNRDSIEMLSEWNNEVIEFDAQLTVRDVVDYCSRVSQRKDRPIGSVLKLTSHALPYVVQLVFDLLLAEINARLTFLNGRKCATIPINDSTELNIHDVSTYMRTPNHIIESYRLAIEVCSRGAATDRDVNN